MTNERQPIEIKNANPERMADDFKRCVLAPRFLSTALLYSNAVAARTSSRLLSIIDVTSLFAVFRERYHKAL